MSEYKGKTVTIDVPAQRVADKFADLSKLQESFSHIPAEQIEKVGKMHLEPQAIVIENPMVGEMRFDIVERNDRRIALVCDKPLHIGMAITMEPNADNSLSTDVTTAIDVDLPFFMKPIIGSKMQFVADGFADMVSAIARAESAEDCDNA